MLRCLREYLVAGSLAALLRNQVVLERILVVVAVDRHLELVDRHLELVDRHLELVDRHLELVDRLLELVDRLHIAVELGLVGNRNLVEPC